MTTVAWVALWLAAAPAVLYAANVRRFRPPPPVPGDGAVSLSPVSVLIPARDEEGAIAACVEAVLASTGIELEVVVLDDHSEDRTAAVVAEIARKEPRVRLESAPPLPPGWAGKPHACHVLARHARFPVIAFLDADVRLTPDALARMARFLDTSGAAFVSGFPRQETGTLLERLLLPLIHWLLLGYLPLGAMRRSRRPAFGAGCGQLVVTRADAYERVGGHGAVRASFHDGLKLPRAYRAAGYGTDVCDATDLAACRMYLSARGVWLGLAKNAREGLAVPQLILLWMALLLGGHVLPAAVLTWAAVAGHDLAVPAAAVTLSYLPRLDAARRFHQSWLGAALHPLGVLVLLAIQWYATARAVWGRPVGWKGRPLPRPVAAN